MKNNPPTKDGERWQVRPPHRLPDSAPRSILSAPFRLTEVGRNKGATLPS